MGREVSGSITYAVETADNLIVGTALTKTQRGHPNDD